ncbi:hypothetical protein BaRGS_00036609, partial [Batillaria attramentaria]
TPCTENTHTCNTATQFCVEQNGTAGGFSCECLRADEQLANNQTCVVIPESQRLYVETPLNVTGADRLQVLEILSNSSIPENAIKRLFSTVDKFKTAIFLEFVSGRTGDPRMVQFSLLFTEEVTSQIRHDVARVLLAVEAEGKVIVGNVTFGVVGHSGIYDEKSKLDSENDGTTISGPQAFSTDGTRDLQLSCDPGDVTKVTSLAWNVTCAQKSDGVFRDSICTLRPNPKFDDGMVVACSASYTGGLNATSSFVTDLNYPPESAPMIEGYESGKVVAAGQRLRMTCTVSGGKPLVTSVNFSCPGHPDVEPDDVADRTVISTLTIGALAAEDDGITDYRGKGRRGKERLGRDNTYNKPELDPDPSRSSDPYTTLHDPADARPGAGDSGYLNPVAATTDHPFPKGGNFKDARSARGGTFTNPRAPFGGHSNPRSPAEGIVNPSAPHFPQGDVAHNPKARGGDLVHDLADHGGQLVPGLHSGLSKSEQKRPPGRLCS